MLGTLSYTLKAMTMTVLTILDPYQRITDGKHVNILISPDRQKRSVAGDYHFGFRGKRCAEHDIVVSIWRNARLRVWSHNLGIGSITVDDFIDGLTRCFDLFRKFIA